MHVITHRADCQDIAKHCVIMPHSDSTLPAVGSRSHIGDCKATVRYVGEVQGQTDTWVGVEWDDASRGKNDGL